jgi:hypothetical protein
MQPFTLFSLMSGWNKATRNKATSANPFHR